MAKATIAEVAARAGVTKSTVSHALSGKRPVAPETRQRIEAAIAELGYRPNPVAQRLAAGRSRAVGLVFPAGQEEITLLDTPFVSSAARVVARRGYTLALVQPEPDAFRSLADLLAGGLLDGALLLHAGLRDARVDVARVSELPFVLIGRAADNAGLSFVDVDIDAAVDLAVDHLNRLGHQKIAFLKPADARDGMMARALPAYELACARRRIRLLTTAAGPTTRSAQAAASSLLRERMDVTGIVAWSEWAGWGAKLAAEDAGRRVPDDLSIVCLAHGLGSGLLPFEPTRVELRIGQLAETATALLLEQLDGEATGEQQILLQPEFILGQTTTAP